MRDRHRETLLVVQSGLLGLSRVGGPDRGSRGGHELTEGELLREQAEDDVAARKDAQRARRAHVSLKPQAGHAEPD